MKTTIEIPDRTLRRAKGVAGSRGVSLKQLFTQALEEKLSNKPAGTRSPRPSWMRLAGAFGKTRAERAETRRIQRRIDREFEKIEPEDRM